MMELHSEREPYRATIELRTPDGKHATLIALRRERGPVPHRIVYASRKRPHDRNRELRVDIRRGTIIDSATRQD